MPPRGTSDSAFQRGDDGVSPVVSLPCSMVWSDRCGARYSLQRCSLVWSEKARCAFRWSWRASWSRSRSAVRSSHPNCKVSESMRSREASRMALTSCDPSSWRTGQYGRTLSPLRAHSMVPPIDQLPCLDTELKAGVEIARHRAAIFEAGGS